MSAVMAGLGAPEVVAPRRRDEVLPEHVTRWPATAAVRELVVERYDGSSGTSHEIGMSLDMPGWRVEQIADELGIGDARRLAAVKRLYEELAHPANAANAAKGRRRNGPATLFLTRDDESPARGGDGVEGDDDPDRGGIGVTTLDDAITMVKAQRATAHAMGASGAPILDIEQEILEELAATRSDARDERPICVQCGQRFATWRVGRGFSLRCHLCAGHKRLQREEGRSTGIATGNVEPVAMVRPVVTPAEKEAAASPVASPVAIPLLVAPPAGDAREEPQTFLERPGPGEDLIFGLLDLLPATASWSARQRDRWLAAFGSTLGLLIEVVGNAGDTGGGGAA